MLQVKNAIDVRISFSFKGIDYAPKMRVDLDALMNGSGKLPDFYMALARQDKIDTYSYLYEVMESSELCFENATGLAEQCVHEGRFDMAQFEALWHQSSLLLALQAIVKKQGLTESADLMVALNQAYELGKQK